MPDELTPTEQMWDRVDRLRLEVEALRQVVQELSHVFALQNADISAQLQRIANGQRQTTKVMRRLNDDAIIRANRELEQPLSD